MANQPRVYVLTTEPPPLAGLATTGAGLRAWALAQGLRSAGHDDVTLVVAADAFAAQGAEVPPVPKSAPVVKAVARKHLADWFRDQKPDAVVAQHWGLLRQVGPLACPLAIDLAGPHLLERRHWGSRDADADRREKLEALAKADTVVCSGASQRCYFLPYLLDAGFEARPELCPVIPFSMPPDLPTPAKDRDYAAFVFAGFFLPWQDPEKPLRWLLAEADQRAKGRLEFFGGMHPTADVSRGQFESLAEFVENHPRVTRRGVVAFDDLVLSLRKCGAALDLMPPNLERQLAFPSRTAVYLWAGIPVLHNNYDDLAPLIDRYRAGWTLDADDEPGFRKLVGRLVEHWEDVERRSQGAQQLVRECLTWDKTIAPLAQWTLNPVQRKGKSRATVLVGLGVRTGPGSPAGAAARSATTEVASGEGGNAAMTKGSDAEALRRLREDNERLRGELELVRTRKVVQIARRARELSPLLAPIAFVLAAIIGVILFVLFVAADAAAALTGRQPKMADAARRRSHPRRG